MGKVVIKILQGSAPNHVRWASYTSPSWKFLIVYMCQRLWKLASSRQSYYKNYQAYFFWPTLYYAVVRWRWTDKREKLHIQV